MKDVYIDTEIQKYGRLTPLYKTKKKSGTSYKWMCRCDCGAIKDVSMASLRAGNSRSCGCLHKERVAEMGRRSKCGSTNPNWRGGKTKHHLYKSYMDMIARCNRKTHPRYSDYGGRGITVCDEWRNDFWAFVRDIGDRPPNMSMDRIDNDGSYCKENVQWATLSQQAKNRRGCGPERQ